ncbi:MAG: hypothetical protein Ct9H90mP14_1440 [Methanobacteriota archaeon]|nr:MAG: hypothetical protein Ct9H90mP14_1440 [Euryarchaeota archaeon]
MAKKTASEKLDEEDGSIVIDADEEQATIDDLPGVGPATAKNCERQVLKNYSLLQ